MTDKNNLSYVIFSVLSKNNECVGDVDNKIKILCYFMKDSYCKDIFKETIEKENLRSNFNELYILVTSHEYIDDKYINNVIDVFINVSMEFCIKYDINKRHCFADVLYSIFKLLHIYSVTFETLCKIKDFFSNYIDLVNFDGIVAENGYIEQDTGYVSSDKLSEIIFNGYRFHIVDLETSKKCNNLMIKNKKNLQNI